MKSYWKFLAAWWPDDATEANLPAEGAAGTYVPQIDTTTRIVTWQQAAGASGAEILVDEVTGEILIDEVTGHVLYDG